MRHARLALVFGLSLAAASAHSALADNLIQNGGFETGDFTSWSLNPATNYTIVSAADTANGLQPTTNQNGYYVHTGTYAAQLGSLTPATLSQTFADVAGAHYQLSFFLYGDPGVLNSVDTFSATLNTDTFLDMTDFTGLTWNQYTYAFTGTGSDTVAFSFSDQDEFISLDDVSVTAAAPEPSSMMLLGTGLLSAAAAARRRIARS